MKRSEFVPGRAILSTEHHYNTRLTAYAKFPEFVTADPLAAEKLVVLVVESLF